MRRLVVGSPVHQKPAVLRHFLNGLYQMDVEDLEVDHVFVDDNEDPASSALLQEFAHALPRVLVVPVGSPEEYVCDDVTHRWNERLIWRVAAFKDAIIEHVLEKGHDGLFLADSDLVLHPGTLRHLASLGCDVVSEVFWTRWTPDAMELPQVWSQDVYDIVPKARGEELTAQESQRRLELVLGQLRTPGLYEVGGLGACTLISRHALETGARFAEIPNLSFWGEDRHFCVRAAALGLQLHADTTLPPLHLYRSEDVARVPGFAATSGLRVNALDGVLAPGARA
jgi:hypothetical protein